MMNSRFVLTVGFALGLAVCAAPAGAQATHPKLVPESIGDFSAALQQRGHVRLSSAHLDATKYRAYRFIEPGYAAVAIARSVRVDADGHLRIIGEPGTVVNGHATTAMEYSHILLPASVKPPQ